MNGGVGCDCLWEIDPLPPSEHYPRLTMGYTKREYCDGGNEVRHRISDDTPLRCTARLDGRGVVFLCEDCAIEYEAERERLKKLHQGAA